MSLVTPVAFLIFNRPELTKQVFAAIRKAKPKKLLIVADGPRFLEEIEKCQKAREIITKVDWDCEVLTNFSETNLGCKKRVSSGLDWVFSEVEEAIILEDDCLPAPSFFDFCQTLLEHYRHDERVMHISGDNFQNSQNRNNYSYYLSKYIHVWGWASWRRAWNYYDVDMKMWSEFKKIGMINSICESIDEQTYWNNIFENVFNGAINTWDYQWLYACWSQSGLSIIPSLNLVSNIGFGPDATHTTSESSLSRLSVTDIWDIKHPKLIVRDANADNYTFKCHYGGMNMKKQIFIFNVKNTIKSIKSVFKQ